MVYFPNKFKKEDSMDDADLDAGDEWDQETQDIFD